MCVLGREVEVDVRCDGDFLKAAYRHNREDLDLLKFDVIGELRVPSVDTESLETVSSVDISNGGA